MFDYDSPVNVQGYDPSLGTRRFRTISGVIAYIHPYTRIQSHLVVYQAVHVPDLQHHLLCPMQCRDNGVTVNDCPRLYCADPTDELHAIVTKDEDGNKVVLSF